MWLCAQKNLLDEQRVGAANCNHTHYTLNTLSFPHLMHSLILSLSLSCLSFLFVQLFSLGKMDSMGKRLRAKKLPRCLASNSRKRVKSLHAIWKTFSAKEPRRKITQITR